ENAARGNGERKVPRRRDHYYPEGIHLSALELDERLLQRLGIVASEVDSLGHFGIRLGHRLGAVDDHGADEISAARGEDACRLLENGPALREGTGRPPGLSGARRVERAAHLLPIGEGVAIGDALGARTVAHHGLAGPRDEGAPDLERNGL